MLNHFARSEVLGSPVRFNLLKRSQSWLASFLGAILFYTIIPLPPFLTVQLEHIARWVPLVGMLLGLMLGCLDWILGWLGFPPLVRSALVISNWVALTGGLHLDGASDTADGLAVTDRERRLTVMQDSTTGAFGAMAIALILLLKTLALAELIDYRWFCLILAAGWSRWGQVAAIAFYPYLKPTGKGARHRQNFQFPQDLLLGVSILLAYSGFFSYQHPQQSLVILGMTCGAAAIALLSGWWFARQLGGHTGDSYGAIVEWSEAFILCLLTLVFH